MQIGHSLHTEDPLFREFTLENDSVKNLIRGLGLHQDPRGTLLICGGSGGTSSDR